MQYNYELQQGNKWELSDPILQGFSSNEDNN